MDLQPEKIVFITYRNYKGITAKRKVLPQELWFGHTEYHPENGWLLRAFDLEKNAMRDFSVRDISCWEPCEKIS